MGTFTGYMPPWPWPAPLPEDGRLIACDVSEEWTRIARRYWEEAGLSKRIDLRLGPAAETLAALLSEGAAESLDFAFIDADKESYDAYYEACQRLGRPGGLIAVDNTLWSGKVADPAVRDAETEAIRALNLKMRDDARVEACLLTVGDGVMLGAKAARNSATFGDLEAEPRPGRTMPVGEQDVIDRTAAGAGIWAACRACATCWRCRRRQRRRSAAAAEKEG